MSLSEKIPDDKTKRVNWLISTRPIVFLYVFLYQINDFFSRVCKTRFIVFRSLFILRTTFKSVSLCVCVFVFS